MSILIRIPVTGDFDASTELPAGVQWRKDGPGVYTLLDSAGDALVDVGLISGQDLVASGLFKFDAFALKSIVHNAGASVTVFRADVVVSDGSSELALTPARSTDPSAQPDAGALLVAGPASSLRLESNQTGAQVVVLEIESLSGAEEINGFLAIANEADPEPASVWGSMFLSDIVAGNADVAQLVWQGPRAEIVEVSAVVSGQISAGHTLVLTGSINGVAITNGAITLPSANPVGTPQSASPTAANIVEPGDVISFVGSGTNTTAGHGQISVRATPIA